MYIYACVCVHVRVRVCVPLHVIKILFWPTTDSTFKFPSLLHDGQCHSGFSGQNLSKESAQCQSSNNKQKHSYTD